MNISSGLFLAFSENLHFHVSLMLEESANTNLKESINMKYWLLVVIAAFFEVGWVIGLKYAATPLEWTGTIIAIIVSFAILIYASGVLPVGTVYAVFVGLGTFGTVISDMVLFNSPVEPLKILFIVTLLAGVIMLKLVTPDNDAKGSEQ